MSSDDDDRTDAMRRAVEQMSAILLRSPIIPPHLTPPGRHMDPSLIMPPRFEAAKGDYIDPRVKEAVKGPRSLRNKWQQFSRDQKVTVLCRLTRTKPEKWVMYPDNVLDSQLRFSEREKRENDARET